MSFDEMISASVKAVLAHVLQVALKLKHGSQLLLNFTVYSEIEMRSGFAFGRFEFRSPQRT